jgi:drug/metabolite transporter (DMT)-like permease
MQHHQHTGRGVALLTLATFLWGTTFVVTKNALANFPPGELILGRSPPLIFGWSSP